MIPVVKRRKRTITNLERLLEAKLDDFISTFKRRPSPREFRQYLERIDRDLYYELDTAVKSQMRKQYVLNKKAMQKELNTRLPLVSADRTALTVLTTQPVLSQSLQGIKRKTISQLRDVFEKMYSDPGGFNLKRLQSEIKDISGVADYRAERIARTEGNKVAVAARRQSYLQADPKDTFKYEWIGPNDNRTTDVSRRIKARTKGGVSWSELIAIVQDEATKMIPNWRVSPIAPVSHPNSRHIPVRVQ